MFMLLFFSSRDVFRSHRSTHNLPRNLTFFLQFSRFLLPKYSLSRVYLANFTSNVWEYDTLTGNWTMLVTTGLLVPRVEIPAVIVNDDVTMFLFGGDSEDELLSDNVFHALLAANSGSFSPNFATKLVQPVLLWLVCAHCRHAVVHW